MGSASNPAILLVLATCLCASVHACSSASGGDPGVGTSGAGAGAGAAAGIGGGGAVGVDTSIGVDSQGNTPACPDETKFVYVVTGGANPAELYRFDPPSLTFSLVGKLSCPGAKLTTPFSMSVDRRGTAWVVFTDGKLYQVDTKTAACTATSFVPGQAGFTTFGMGFASDAPGSVEETLYVSRSAYTGGGTSETLGRIDTKALTLTKIGDYDKLKARAELTGTGDARLFGAFEGTPYIVAEIDKGNAQILSQAPQSSINYKPNSSNFAFAFWGGDFWVFAGPGTSTDVFQYKPSDGTTSKVQSVTFEIVGAGVSTCAPLQPPK